LRKNTFKVNNISDVMTVSKSISHGDIVPIFQISNVTGQGLNLIHEFLNLLEPRLVFDGDKPVEYYIDATYSVSGVGTVVGGFLANGTLKSNKSYFLGPTKTGDFIPIKIRSLHVKRTLVTEAVSGRYVCANIPKLKREDISKGMAIIEYDPQKHGKKITAIYQFTAEIIVRESHHTTIRPGYQVSLTINSLRTTVQIMNIHKRDKIALKHSGEQLKASNEQITEPSNKLAQGDRATVEFKLLFQPGYFNINDRIVLSEGDVRMVGRVVSLN
jgi:GTPase